MEALEEEKLALDTKITASEHAASLGGSQIWLEPGVFPLLSAQVPINGLGVAHPTRIDKTKIKSTFVITKLNFFI